ncbi:hypothetical protein FACS189447_09900 [Spirochaetia bacterium]|nr:hypothetical protein FACS189447_09900 [Spirochaetia bacterium]
MKKKKYKSEIMMVIHQMMEDLYEVGGITAERMHEFDEDCLVPEPDTSTRDASSHKPVTPAYARTTKSVS